MPILPQSGGKDFMETLLGCDKPYNSAKIVVFGAPFDGTTSYRPGTRFASKAIRSEAYGLETYSPQQDADITERDICDIGDIDISLGETVKVLQAIEAKTSGILHDGKLPVMIGGEHLVTLGAVRAFAKRYTELNIIHFDAHTDLRDEFFGSKLSHATVMRRCWELLGDGRIYQFGIRSGIREEFEWAKTHVHMHKFDFSGLEAVVHQLYGKPVYFTLDLDVLDPSVFPGTGTPEPGGVSYKELMNAVASVCRLNIVGCDINELSPVYDQSGTSTIVALKVLRELLLALKSE